MAFTPTLTVLEALKAKIAALQWTPPATPGNPNPAAETAFQKVELFDLEDLSAALRELLVFKDRACFIALDTDRVESEIRGQKIQCRQVRTVSLLITDRDYGKRARALTGSDTKPGVLALKDLILVPNNGVIGLLLPGIAVLPTLGTTVRIEGEKRDELSGRLAFNQDLELRGGFVEASLGTAPIL